MPVEPDAAATTTAVPDGAAVLAAVEAPAAPAVAAAADEGLSRADVFSKAKEQAMSLAGKVTAEAFG
jgi:hypothetical protein